MMVDTQCACLTAAAGIGIPFAFQTSASCLRPPPSSQHRRLLAAFSPYPTCLANLDSVAVRISCCFAGVRHFHCPPATGPRSALGDDHDGNYAVVSAFDDTVLSEDEAESRVLSPRAPGEVNAEVESVENANGSSFQLAENGRASFDKTSVVKPEPDSERFKLQHGREVFEERAYLVSIERKGQQSSFGTGDSLAELAQLADTAGLLVVGTTYQKLDHPNPRTYIGSGKVSELRTAVNALDIETVIFDDELSPGQLRNLEKALGNEVRVCDRTALILDIFSQRAATREATLQVQLAQMDYQLPRLTKMWAHLERQAGGMVKGMGEKQIEVDKRILRNRMGVLRKELDAVREHRQQYRDRRGSVPIPVVSLVGYTNAGKSTLLNRLSGAGVLAEDRLFATLDPTTRRIELPNGNECLITDTVGFIQKLPTQLVASFRATLEEINDSSLLVHVVDISHPLAKEQMEAVESVLAELNVEHIPQITVWNKVDRAEKQNLRAEAEIRDDVVCISAFTGEGVASLCKAIQSKIKESLVWVDVLLPYGKGEFVNIMHRLGVVDSVDYLEEGISLKAHVPLALSRQLQPMRQPA